ncbi:3-hydroxyacyl-CoA dehydrogenase family protein [Bacillus sp. JJ1533]|uniref:3-hydroxyacyl-CoA dehydrogenase family protein n=1 Tax=Bacillus sp. JJ1533 TaxID=3122959 RepID=UPI002FFDC70C
MDIKKIGIVGAGTMGSGIAFSLAKSGFVVYLFDTNQEYLNKAINKMISIADKLFHKGKLSSEEVDGIISNIMVVETIDKFEEVDFVIEAIIEDLEAKQNLFLKLDDVCRKDVILTSNTSSMSITSLASVTKRPQKVAGMHFFNPAYIMNLVEVIRGLETSDNTVNTINQIVHKLGKESVEVKKDSPGFLVNRLLVPQVIEAIKLVEEGVATPEDIDKAVKFGLNYPMGPFELMDFTGIDISFNVMNYFYSEFHEAQYAPPKLLKQMVTANRLGKKTNIGWYDYRE